jgi:hypothetical protein
MANWYFKIFSNGVPQVTLATWLDCYDFASRVEQLEIGRCGNRKAKPRWRSNELGPILQDVVLDRNAIYSVNARGIADKCKNKGGGRNIAARAVVDVMNQSESRSGMP